jgi:hypothetical protein
MSARVDVLAQMDWAHAAFSGKQAGELFAARAAVAELIEAVREYRLELRKPIGCGTYEACVARVDTALDNIGPAS